MEKSDLSGDLKDQGEEDPKKARQSSVTSCVANHEDVFQDAQIIQAVVISYIIV